MPLQPKTWEELVKLIEDKQLPGPEPRFAGDELVYTNYRNNMDRIINLSILDEQIRLWKERYNKQSNCLLPNLFDYSKILHYLPYVKHFVLWLDEDSRGHFTTLYIYDWLSLMYGVKVINLSMIYYENNSEDKSIPEKPHYQVFVNFQNYKICQN